MYLKHQICSHSQWTDKLEHVWLAHYNFTGLKYVCVQKILYLSQRQRETEEGESMLSEIKASSEHPLSHTHNTEPFKR